MVEHQTQEWRITIGKIGNSCEVFCNGVKLTNIQAADVHLEVGALSTLRLRLASLYRPREEQQDPDFRQGDTIVACGTPMFTSFAIGGQEFQVINKHGENWLIHRLHKLMDRWDAMVKNYEHGATFYSAASDELERILRQYGLDREQNVTAKTRDEESQHDGLFDARQSDEESGLNL